MHRALPASGLVLAVLAVAVVALGLGGAWSSASSPRDEVVSVAHHGGAPVLVDGQGHTLYIFTADMHRTSRCSGACARAWPPVTTQASVRVGTGVQGDLLGFADRSDGREQITYAGRPLYRRAPGAETATAFGGRWRPVAPNGAAIARAAAVTGAS